MKLYLARHGDYVLDTLRGVDVLSEKGISDITELANWIKPMNLQVSSILHSGKYRAQQTAEILAQGFTCDQPPATHPGLQPDDDSSCVANELLAWNEDILIVGHLPFMGKLVSLLITGDDSKHVVNFQTGTLVRLSQSHQTRWIIDWVLTPSLFFSPNSS